MLLMLVAGLRLIPSHEAADVGINKVSRCTDMRVLLGPAPFMSVCALHCLQDLMFWFR